ncbi:zinc finger and SCAN domain-containing protein 5B [Molossus nigricans]
MSADQMFSWGHGKPQDSLGSELPPCTPPHAHLTERGDWDSEMWHMVFRTFSSSEESDPVKDLHTLSRLCCHWLRPDLHTMEQILDKLVIEQFLISMSPELQVLVKESAVETCKDLENLLRKNEKPKKWTIVTIEGKMFLEKKSDVQMEEAQISDMDHVWDLSMTPQSCESQMEIHPEDSQEVNQELESQSGISEMSSGQGEKVLLPETIPKKGDLEGVMLEEDLMQDEEETTVLTSPEPQLLRGPEDSVGEKNPQEGICMENVDADVPSTHGDNTSIPQDVHQEEAISLDKGKFSGTLKSNSVRAPSTGEPTGRRDGKGATKRALYECKDCRKSFSYESQLTLHQRTHTGERPFKCTQCSKGFMQSSDLQVHQRIHTGEKPYCCNFCKMTFTHESTLRGHQRVHTKERPYLCKVCHKSFSHKGNLNVHLRIHSDMKPYLCHECNQAFRQLGTLKRHQKTHINRTPQ